MTLSQTPSDSPPVPETPYYLEGAAHVLAYHEANQRRLLPKPTAGEMLISPLVAAGQLYRDEMKIWLAEELDEDPFGQPVRRLLIKGAETFRTRLSVPALTENGPDTYGLDPTRLPLMTPALTEEIATVAARRWLIKNTEQSRLNVVADLIVRANLTTQEAEILNEILKRQGNPFYINAYKDPELIQSRRDAGVSLRKKLRPIFRKAVVLRTEDRMGFYAAPELLDELTETTLEDVIEAHGEKYGNYVPVPQLLAHQMREPRRVEPTRQRIGRSQAILDALDYIESQDGWMSLLIRDELISLLEQFPEAQKQKTTSPGGIPDFLNDDRPAKPSIEEARRAANKLFRFR